MGRIYQQQVREARKLQKKMGRILLALFPFIVGGWFVDYFLEWHYILAIVTSSFYGFFVFFYVILRAINK